MLNPYFRIFRAPMSAGNAPQSFEVRTLHSTVSTTLHPRVARESSMAAHAGIPVLNMPDMLRDPVSALAGREVPVSVLQEQAVSFLHGCHICFAHLSRQVLTGKPARHVRGTPAAVSEPTLLFHASNRQPPCGTAATRVVRQWPNQQGGVQRNSQCHCLLLAGRCSREPWA